IAEQAIVDIWRTGDVHGIWSCMRSKEAGDIFVCVPSDAVKSGMYHQFRNASRGLLWRQRRFGWGLLGVLKRQLVIFSYAHDLRTEALGPPCIANISDHGPAEQAP